MKTPSIEELLLEPQSVTIAGKTKDITLWVRPLTDIERSLAQGAARAQSRSLRKTLSNPDTEEYQLLIKNEVEEYTREQLNQAWVASNLVSRAMQMRRKSLEDRDETYVPEPEPSEDGTVFPTAEEMEAYEEAVEVAEENREKNVSEAIKNVKKQLEEEVAEMDEDGLRKAVEPRLIDSICGNVWNREYSIQSILRGTFKDKEFTKPAFKSVSDVYALKDNAKQKLAEAHMALLLDPDSIKNLEGSLK